MIDDYVRKRLEKEYEYQSAKLKNLFSHVFRNKDAAWVEWESAVSRFGFDETIKILRGKPQKFGALKGRAWFGFLRNQAFHDRERALKEAYRIAENWYSSRLQLDTVDVRVGEVKEKVKNTLEEEKQRQRRHSRTPERGRSR